MYLKYERDLINENLRDFIIISQIHMHQNSPSHHINPLNKILCRILILPPTDFDPNLLLRENTLPHIYTSKHKKSISNLHIIIIIIIQYSMYSGRKFI